MSEDETRMRHGTELNEQLSEAQRKELDAAMERVRMGESCWFHELAELILARDDLNLHIYLSRAAKASWESRSDHDRETFDSFSEYMASMAESMGEEMLGYADDLAPEEEYDDEEE